MRRPPFTIEQLRSFVAVAESEHVSRAAASLFLTQAAVTQQIRHLETGLGLQLLERDGRRIRLTDAGRGIAEACRAALRAMEVVDDTALAIKQLSAGSLHVGGSPTCASFYLPPHLAEFTRRHPSIKLDVVVAPTADLNRRVVAGSLDCALIEGEAAPSLLSVEISPDELIMVAHRDHPLSHKTKVTAADLLEYRYIRRGPEFSAERHVRRSVGEIYERFDSISVGHHEYVRAATIAGLGFAALPKRAVISDLRSGILKALPVPPMARSITAIRRHSRGGPAQEAFWELLTGAGGDGQPASARITRDGERA